MLLPLPLEIWVVTPLPEYKVKPCNGCQASSTSKFRFILLPSIDAVTKHFLSAWHIGATLVRLMSPLLYKSIIRSVCYSVTLISLHSSLLINKLLCTGPPPSPLCPSSSLLTLTGVPARQRLHQHIGSSPRVSQNWPRNPSSRTRRRCSWSLNPGRCRSCSFGPSPLRFHGRIIACNGRWVSSGQTCRQCGSLLRCVSWNTRWHPSPGPSTASLHAQRGAVSIGCRCHQTWGCRWALGAGRPV